MSTGGLITIVFTDLVGSTALAQQLGDDAADEIRRSHFDSLRQAVEAMGCDVTSNMTSLIVLNLPGRLKGKEKELVQGARAKGFGIWPTLSEPVQVRIGILNQLSPEQITEIVSRFAHAMLAMGAELDKQKVVNQLKSYYAKAA